MTDHSTPVAGTVFVVDDDPSFRQAIARLLNAAGYVVEMFASAGDFLERHRVESRGCVLADLRMPGPSGLDLQAALGQRANPLPVIFLTGHGDIPTSVHAMRGGAEDFLTKPVKREELLKAVRRALLRDAQNAAARASAGELRGRYERLTPREREVLSLIVAGKLNKEIAGDLGATERTIKAHRANIIAKLEVHSVAELARLAQEAGVAVISDQ